MIRKHKIRKQFNLILAMLGLASNITFGQQIGTYQMAFLTQRSYLNPAFHAPVQEVVGLPLLSAVDFKYTNNGFSYSDLVKKRANDSLYLDFQSMLAGLNKRNRMNLELQLDLFSFGLTAGKNYFSLHVTEKADFHFTYSKPLMDFLYYGNAATLGTTQNINPQISGAHYREYGFSWSRDLSSKITAGISYKYLYGMENITTTGMGANLYTDPNDFAITAYSNYSIHTSGIDSSSFQNFNVGHYLSGKKNTGNAFDLGIIYHPNEHLEFSGSVIDIGSINWKENVSNYSTNTSQGSFTYNGIDLNDFINNDTTNAQNYLENLVDSLYSSFDIKTTHESYKWKLPVKMYFNASYIFKKSNTAGILIKRTTINNEAAVDYAISYSKTVKNWLNIMLSYNKINQSPYTIGSGITINFKNDQIYFITDNLPGVFSWQKSYVTGFRAGINLVFGWNTKQTINIPAPTEQQE